MMEITTRPEGTARVGHTAPALVTVIKNWSHTHGTNDEGNVVCVPCMAELLLDIHSMIWKDAARNSDGKMVPK